MKHHVTISYHPICGMIDTPDSRAACSCGWKTGWDNGWHLVTRLRVKRHVRGRDALVTVAAGHPNDQESLTQSRGRLGR